MEQIKQTHLQKLVAALPEGKDAILVSNSRNQRWLTGFPFDDGFVFVTRENSYLLTDSRYIEAAQAQADRAFVVQQMKGTRQDMFSALCEENHVGEVLFEDTWVSCAQFEGFKKWFGEKHPLSPAGKLIEDLREYKDEEEMENIIAAQRIAEQAFDHILGFISPDKTEVEVALELEFFMRSKGATATSFDTIAVSGSASSLPHGVPRNVKLEKGFFTMDYGALYNGYCSDMTRTVVIGKADEDMKKLYNTVLSAQLAAEEALHEGVTGAELDAIARGIIDNSEYKGCFGHSLGHGVGMYIHEAPGVSGGNKKPITKGHVITIEPGIYIAGKYGCRIEDMALFRENGPEVITRCPKHLIEL